MSSIIVNKLHCMNSLMQLKSISNLSRKRWHLAFATIYSYRAFSHPHKSSETPNLSIKRWHLAFATIYYSRAFSHPNKSSQPHNNTEITEITPENHVIDVIPPSIPNINQSSLTELVKNKDLDRLVALGGVEGLISALKTDVEHGISADSEDISQRREAFGINTYPRPPTESFISFFTNPLKPLSIRLYLICNAIAFVIDMKEGGSKERWFAAASLISSFVLVYTTVIFRQIQYDKKYMVNNFQVDVVRNGRRQQISVFDIVVGDIVCLKIGDQVPGDGLFVEGHSLQIDEESIRRGTEHMEVNLDKNPFIFSGTKVTDGYGKFVVTSVGLNTIWGEMMCSVIRKLISKQLKILVAVCFLLTVYAAVEVFTRGVKDEDRKTGFNKRKHNVIDFINAVMGIIAQGRVKKQYDYDTMDSTTNTCTDKAGTLTLNQMKVIKVWLGQETMEGRSFTSIASSVIELFYQGVGLNTTSSVYKHDPGSGLEDSDSPTEKAILSWIALELNMDMEELKRGSKLLHVETFNSEKKKSGILLKKNDDNTMHVHWKGAAEMVIAMCTHYYDSLGNMKSINDTEKENFSRIVQGSSLRWIAFAHTQVLDYECYDGKANLKDHSLTLLGLVGIMDPCQPVEGNVVQDFQHAGVNGKIITGDNVFTAKASGCKILRLHQDLDRAMVEGLEFQNCTPTERMKNNIAVLTASRWGKCVYNSIEGFIHFHLTANLSALVVNFVAAISSGEVPLTENQLMGVTVIIESLVLLPTKVNPSSLPTKEPMDKRPVGRTEPLKLNVMWRNLTAQTLYQIAVLLTLQLRGEKLFNVKETVKYTLVFNTYVLCQICNEFNGRMLEKKHVFEGMNKSFLKIIGLIIVHQVFILEVMKKTTDTERLSLWQWGACIGIAILSWAIDFLVKHIHVPKKTNFIPLKWKNMISTFMASK